MTPMLLLVLLFGVIVVYAIIDRAAGRAEFDAHHPLNRIVRGIQEKYDDWIFARYYKNPRSAVWQLPVSRRTSAFVRHERKLQQQRSTLLGTVLGNIELARRRGNTTLEAALVEQRDALLAESRNRDAAVQKVLEGSRALVTGEL